jgi:murein DD-endopeptidase MepM/ murein hydrolase activator NlpD
MGKMTPSGFSYGYKESGEFHPGKDYSGAGNPPIRASANGVVIVADACSRADCIGLYQQAGAFDPNVNKGYGNVIIIEYPYNSLPAVVQGDIGLSEGESLCILYAHLQNAPTLYAGDTVRPGQIIGNAGNSGNSGGSHLHHETRIGKTGSLSLGDMCTDTSCSLGSARFDTWYNAWQRRPRPTTAFEPFDPATLYYYSARELRMMQP